MRVRERKKEEKRERARKRVGGNTERVDRH